MSVVADSILPNAQKGLFLGSSRLEVTLHQYLYLTHQDALRCYPRPGRTSTNDAEQTIGHVSPTVYTFVAYAGHSIHMNVVKRFGGVVAVLIMTGRKG
jgi:hypothetical protein